MLDKDTLLPCNSAFAAAAVYTDCVLCSETLGTQSYVAAPAASAAVIHSGCV